MPFALAHDRRSFFAAIHRQASRGSRRSTRERVRSGTSRRSRIRPLDQADGAFDGRWLVWSEYHSLSGLDDFTVWAWDSRSGQVTQIGAASGASAGEFWPSPLRAPDALNGIATWVQGTGPEGIAAVHVYDLRTGRGTIIHRGHAQGSFLVGRRLVGWPESPGPGRVTRMRVASALTGKSGKVPRALRALLRRFGAGHRRTADRISECEVHVGPVVAVPAPEPAPNRHRPLARSHRRFGAGRRPVHQLRDLAPALRRRHEDAPLRANRPPRGLGAPRRHDAARGFRFAQESDPPAPADRRRPARQAAADTRLRLAGCLEQPGYPSPACPSRRRRRPSSSRAETRSTAASAPRGTRTARCRSSPRACSPTSRSALERPAHPRRRDDAGARLRPRRERRVDGRTRFAIDPQGLSSYEVDAVLCGADPRVVPPRRPAARAARPRERAAAGRRRDRPPPARPAHPRARAARRRDRDRRAATRCDGRLRGADDLPRRGAA